MVEQHIYLDNNAILTNVLLFITQYYLDSSVVLPQLAYTITEVLLSITQYYLDSCVVQPQLAYTITEVVHE
jgi:hypothetical protein